MFVVTVTFRVKEELFNEFLEKMKEQADNSLTLEPGCLQFDICSNPENE